MEKLKISIAKPFGPTIAKVTIPEDMILKLNNYIDEVIIKKKINLKLIFSYFGAFYLFSLFYYLK